MSEQIMCDVCKEKRSDVSREPTRSQLLFGGFRVSTENRCSDCERKVAAWVSRQLRKI